MTFDEWYATQKHQLANEQVCRVIWDAATTAERNRTDSAIDSLTRADYRPSGIFRHYYPSTSGDWVCLRELKTALRSNAEITRGVTTDQNKCGA